MKRASCRTGEWVRRQALCVLLLVLAPAAAAAGCEGLQALAPGQHDFKLEVAGVERDFIVLLPDSYNETVASPVIFDNHATTINALLQFRISELSKVALPAGYIIVGMNAVKSWGGINNQWMIDPDGTQADGGSDVAFAAAVLEFLDTVVCYDHSAVGMTGFSGGARLSCMLACEMDTHPISAIAPVAGLRYPSGCPVSSPLPVLAFHGSADDVNTWAGPSRAPWWTSGVLDAFCKWAVHNGCTTEIEVQRVAGTDLDTWSISPQCLAPTVLYVSVGATHTYPGGMVLPEEEGRVQEMGLPGPALITQFFQAAQDGGAVVEAVEGMALTYDTCMAAMTAIETEKALTPAPTLAPTRAPTEEGTKAPTSSPADAPSPDASPVIDAGTEDSAAFCGASTITTAAILLGWFILS